MAYAEKLDICPACGCDGRQWRYDRQVCEACGHGAIGDPKGTRAQELRDARPYSSEELVELRRRYMTTAFGLSKEEWARLMATFPKQEQN